MNSNQNVSKYLQNLHLPGGISKTDEDFLKTALCVPDLGTYQFTGVPDKESAPSFLRHTSQELDINMNSWYNSTPANNGSALEVVQWPWERNELLFDAISQSETVTIVDHEFDGVNTGGYGIYVQSPTSGSVFPTGTSGSNCLNSAPNAGAGYVMNPPDSFLAGERGRMVATWLEVIPTGSETYSTGGALTWEVSRSPQRSKLQCGDQYGQIAINGNLFPIQDTVDNYPNGPPTTAAARTFFKTEDWDRIMDGCFLQCNNNFEDCEAQYPVARSKYIETANSLSQGTGAITDVTDTSVSGMQNIGTSLGVTAENTRAALISGLMVQAEAATATDGNGLVQRFSNPRNYHSDRTLKGIIMTNLNTGSAAGSTTVADSFKFVAHWVFEAFPDGSNALTASASRKSPPYSPMALEMYSRIAQNLPLSFPLAWNRKKTYLALISQAISQLRGGVPRAMVKAGGKSVVAQKLSQKGGQTRTLISITGPGPKQNGTGKAKKKKSNKKSQKGKQLLLKM